MDGGLSKNKALALISVIIVSSGLIAWALLALFQADNARLERETIGQDLYQEDLSAAPQEQELGQEIVPETALPANPEPNPTATRTPPPPAGEKKTSK